MNAYIEILDTDYSILGTLNVSDNSDFPLALQDKISDINDVLKGGTSSSSKTFRCPATPAINTLLQYLYNANIYDDKDMKNIKPCRLVVEGVQYHNYNKIKFTDVIQKNGRPSEYECVLYGENYEWVDYFRELMITDLDYYDGTTDVVTYTKGALNTVFSTTYDYGYDYWWSLKNYGGWKTWNEATVEDFRPDIYIKSIWREGYKRVGYTLSSDFIDGSIFKKLLFPLIGDGFTISDSDIENNKIVVAKTTPQGTVASNVAITFPVETSDPGSLWNGSVFTCAKSGLYTIRGGIEFTTFAPSGIFHGGLEYAVNGVGRYLYDTSGNNGYGNWNNATNFFYFDFKLYLNAGDTVSFIAVIDPVLAAVNGLLRNIFVESGDLTISVDPDITEGDTFRIRDVFPKDISVLDIVNGCTDLFNLYFKTDTRLKKVYCEPRNTFYKGQGDALDWTNKLDLSSDYKLSFATNYKRDWSFSYAEDPNDGLVNEENKKFKRKLAELKISLPNRFVKGSQKAGTDFFAPTKSMPAHSISPTGIQDAPTIPAFWKEYPNANQYSNDFAPRILYQEGMVTKNTSYGYVSRWKFHDRTNNFIQIKNQVPLAYMFDSLAGVGANLMYCNDTIGGDGLFKTYWDSTFQVIETGLQLQANYRLTNTELSTIDLRYPVYLSSPPEVKGYWIIDSVGDYKPQDIDLVPVKLIKVTNLNPKATEDAGPDFLDFLTGGAAGFGNGFAGNAGSPGLANNATSPLTTVLNNNSGNYSRQAGNNVLAIGGIANGQVQTVLGRYNQPSETDKLQVGIGRGDANGDRYNLITVDEDDNLKIFGGQIFYEDENGNIQPVYAVVNQDVTFIYKK